MTRRGVPRVGSRMDPAEDGAAADEGTTGPAVRTIEALLALTQGPRTVTEISEEAGLPKATVHRLLNQLLQIGMVYQADNQSYMLGVRALELGQALLNEPAWSSVFMFRPELEELALQTGETATLHVRVGNQRVCIAEHQSPNALRYVGGVGQTVPLHLGSAGKVLLAFAGKDVVDQYLRSIQVRSANGSTPGDSDDAERLRQTIRRVRRSGWAESTGERISGASAISVPVLNHEGELMVVLSILGPTLRLGAEERRHLLPHLRRVATSMALTVGVPLDT